MHPPRFSRAAAVGAVAVLLLDGCGDAAGPAKVAAVEVTPAVATLVTLGETRRLSAVAQDLAGRPLSGVRFTWTSRFPSVATVDSDGLVTARALGTTTITATADGVPGTAVLTVDQVVAGLAFATQPSDAVAGEAIKPAITVELRDAGGSRVADAAEPVTLTLSANPGGATLAGTRTVTSADGVATFSDVWLDKATAGYTLTASAAAVAPATSAAFSVSPGPVQLVFLSQPSTAEGQVPFDPVVQVAARADRFGNAVPDGVVTVGLAVSPSGEALRGVTTVTAVNGVATFPGLSQIGRAHV